MGDAAEVGGQAANYIPPHLRREDWFRHHLILEELVCYTDGWMKRRAFEAFHRVETSAERRAILLAYSDFSEKFRDACYSAMYVDALPTWVVRLARELGTMPSTAEILLRNPDATWPL